MWRLSPNSRRRIISSRYTMYIVYEVAKYWGSEWGSAENIIFFTIFLCVTFRERPDQRFAFVPSYHIASLPLVYRFSIIDRSLNHRGLKEFQTRKITDFVFFFLKIKQTKKRTILNLYFNFAKQILPPQIFWIFCIIRQSKFKIKNHIQKRVIIEKIIVIL